jgi:hypothetical protein
MRPYAVYCAALALAGGASAQTGNAPPSHLDRPSVYRTTGDPQASATARPSPTPAPDPAQPDPGPKVAIARHIVDAAGAFDGYMHRTAKISANFTSGESVARAVELGSVFEPRQLEEGAIAYAALVAMQDPAFVDSVHELGENRQARDALVGRLVEHPEACLDVPSARQAAARVARLLAKIGMNMVAAGAAMKQASYDLQSQPWSKQDILTPKERLARIEAESSAPMTLAPPDTAQLISGLFALRAGAGPEAAAAAVTVTPVVTRGLALAELAILGMAGDDQEQQIAPLLTDATDAECIKMARLNDLQCLAVVGPQYEDVFCLGSFAMMDSGRCIASAAGMSDLDFRPLIDKRSVFVPIAADEASERNPLQDKSRDAAVAAPVAASATPVNYSPYSGPTQP